MSRAVEIITGSFNPEYKPEDQRRMRYLLSKYAQVYGEPGKQYDNPNACISEREETSKLRMTDDFVRPFNPFRDLHDFEKSLEFHRFHVHEGGRDGRFLVSHAFPALSTITQYQRARNSRVWVPGVISQKSRPNDYINLFLHHLKMWVNEYLTAEVIDREELESFSWMLRIIKNDRYHWCFPNDDFAVYMHGNSFTARLLQGKTPSVNRSGTLHDVINTVDDKVTDALAILNREADNKSLHELFKELNAQSINLLGFGKHFIIYLMFTDTRATADLPNRVLKGWKGQTFSQGKLIRHLQVGQSYNTENHMDREQILYPPHVNFGNVCLAYRKTRSIR